MLTKHTIWAGQYLLAQEHELDIVARWILDILELDIFLLAQQLAYWRQDMTFILPDWSGQDDLSEELILDIVVGSRA